MGVSHLDRLLLYWCWTRSSWRKPVGDFVCVSQSVVVFLISALMLGKVVALGLLSAIGCGAERFLFALPW